MTEHIYDLAIIGGGSAALSAGIYAGRSMMDTVIIEKDKIGGQATTTSSIVNYPGIRNGQGPEMMNEMRLQAEEFGTEFKTDEIVSAELNADVKVLTGKNGQTYQARAVMIATGASPNKIGFPGEQEFTGRGIGYCSTCDGEFFTGLDIFVLGGGFAAAEEAVFLTRFAKKVHMIIREPDFTCAEMTANLAKNHPNIDITYNTEVKEISGDGLLSKAIFVNNQTGEETIFEADPEDGSFGMFVFAGNKPNTAVFKDQVEMDPRGFIPTTESMETNLPGVYAIGDLRVKELRQIVTAVADGAIAATKSEGFVNAQKERLGVEITHKEMPVSKPVEEKKETAAAVSDVPAGKWFPAEMKAQLQGIFAKLTKQVTIKNILDASLPKTMELSSFLAEFAELSDKIVVENSSRGDNPELESTINLERLPLAALFNEADEYTGIKFSGIPSGHELNSLVLAVYNVGSDGQPIEAAQKEAIEKLPKAKIQICVSLSCHYCPDVVAACQRIASLNPGIEAEMIDTALFPELKKEKKIMSVPAMIINDEEVIFGAKSMDEIISELAK
ncbi:FAD-dependent oxidoreductase [Vagococcus coleopterorum]|uniref:FAD-dependent oxidoreductase n=1 Tax=Vagococcus coleopterorum TaxID=2714946 RepID=A0A6G8ALM5_9ENTE|nr:FAD-dependent oxidoreductase [Vagococcus coleopterorum]QIL45862.1 FAD-dependent oxidoreductase [Vagococcus coleopterorum]